MYLSAMILDWLLYVLLREGRIG